MPAPCPGDADYVGIPLTRANLDAAFEHHRTQRAPMLAEIDRVQRDRDGWDVAAVNELPEFRDTGN